MRQTVFIVAIILVFSVAYGFAMMHEGGHMMGESQLGQTASPGYGGHMMGGMMGQGGHMIDQGGHRGCGEHMMGGMMGYGSEEDQQKFLDDTTDLRREMHNKKFEISEALRSPDTDRAILLKLKKEMLEIKIKMYDRAIKNN